VAYIQRWICGRVPLHWPKLPTWTQIEINLVREYILRAFKFEGGVRALIDFKDMADSPVEG
jgi:hypothetical protein